MTSKPRRPRQDLANQPELVYATALRYLARRDYSEAELRQLLLRRGAPVSVLDDTLQRLIASKYLDDERFATGRVRHRRDCSRYGQSRIRAELRSLGVDADTVAAALAEEYDEDAEREVLREHVRRVARDIAALPDENARRKCIAAWQRRMLGRGFRAESVYAATEWLRDGSDED